MKNGDVLVEWSNLTERELVDYVIERSADATNFVEVSRFKPTSNENVPVSYSGVDPSPFAGLNYYRIRVNEISGKVIFSIILKIETTAHATDLLVYPNPVTAGQLSWSVSNLPAGKYRIEVINMSGATVFSKPLRLQGKSVAQTIDLPAGLNAGTYRLLLRGDEVEQGRSFIVQ